MLIRALRLETLLVIRDRGLIVAAFALAATLLVSALAGGRADAEQAAALARAAAEVQAAWAKLPPTNPHNAAHYGILVYRPPAPLQAIEPGILPYQGATVFLEAHRRNSPMLSPASVRDAEGRYGAARLGPLLQIAGGFLALLIGFLLGAREIRRGIAPLLAGVGVRGGPAVAAKAIAAGSLVALAAAPALALGAAGLEGGDAFARWGVVALGSLLHLFVLAALGVAMGLLIGASRAGLAAAALVWALGTVVAPRVLDAAAERLVPTTQRELAARLEADFERGPDGHTINAYTERFKADVLKRYGVEQPEDLPINLDGLLMQADEDHRSAVYARHLAEESARREWQDAIRSLAWTLGPTQAALDLSQRAAGSDAIAQRRFEDAAEAFRLDLVRRLNLHMAENSRTGDWEWTPSDDYYASFRAFRPPEPDLAADLWRAAAPAGALVAWGFVAGFGLAWGARRLPRLGMAS